MRKSGPGLKKPETTLSHHNNIYIVVYMCVDGNMNGGSGVGGKVVGRGMGGGKFFFLNPPKSKRTKREKRQRGIIP